MKIPALLALTAVSLTAVGVLAAPAQAKDVDVKGLPAPHHQHQGRPNKGGHAAGRSRPTCGSTTSAKVRRVWTVTVTDGTQTVTRTATTAVRPTSTWTSSPPTRARRRDLHRHPRRRVLQQLGHRPPDPQRDARATTGPRVAGTTSATVPGMCEDRP